jgi:Spy/CpxP family protein refolding chaperone
MRGLFKVSLALGLAVLVASPALAQRGPGGRGGGLAFLLMNKSVQEELKLDKAQTDALEKFRNDNKDDFGKLFNPDTSREDREAAGKKINEGASKVVADVLKAEQKKRLDQIQFQSRVRFEGPGALAGDEAQKALKLTDKQKDQIKELADDYGKQVRDLFQNAGGNREEAFKKIGDLRKEKLDAAMKVLTDDQKKTFKELSGEPFEIKFDRPRRQ